MGMRSGKVLKSARKTAMAKIKKMLQGKEKDPEQETPPEEVIDDVNVEDADGEVEEIDDDEKAVFDGDEEVTEDIEKYNNMTKKELDMHAKDQYNIELDRRLTKQDMINELLIKKRELEKNLKG